MTRITQSLVAASVATSLAVIATPTLADGVVQVPGVTKGYLYDPSSNATGALQEISLAVTKVGHFTEYRIESDPPGLLCDEACPGTAERLPAGSVTLKIVGKKPVPILDIPLTGFWSEPCERAGEEIAHCTFDLHALNARVSVEVSPDINPGMTFKLPEGGEAMIVDINTRDNYVLVANHLKLGARERWLPFDAKWTSRLNIDSPTDGRINTDKIIELRPIAITAARYCKSMGAAWYLPAEKELALLTTDAFKKIPGIDEDSYLWSSTEGNFREGKYKDGRPWRDLTAKALSNSTARISNQYVWSYVKEGGFFWTEEPEYTKRYQALCFRRVPI